MGCPAGFLLTQCRGWAQTSGISVPSSPWSLKGKTFKQPSCIETDFLQQTLDSGRMLSGGRGKSSEYVK